MAKDPAFLFYSSDFITGVSDLTMEERGQYITLLCLQHQKGRLSKKNIGIAVPNATADTMAKFKIDDHGLFYNERLEQEINNRKAHTEKQRQRAIDGWVKRKGNIDATANATALPLEDENENIDSSNIYLEYLEKNHFSKFEQMKMKLGSIDSKEFLDFFESKCVLESQPFDFNKLNARFNILFSNWKKDKPKEDKSRKEAPDLDWLRGN